MELPNDSIILPKTHPPMYLIHKYWARKPYNVVKAYIEKYTKPGDLVLDPFCGSGITIAESILANRNAVGIDINPFSKFLTTATITPVNIEKFQLYLKSIIHELDLIIEDLYGIRCPFCQTSAHITQLIWENVQNDSQKPPDEKIQEIRIKCKNCDLKNHPIDSDKFPNVYENEHKRVAHINSHFTELQKKYKVKIPKTIFKYKNGNKFKQIRHYLIQEPTTHQLFTKRNLLILSAIRKSIDKVIPIHTNNELVSIRNLLLLTFSANLAQSSKMVWVISRRKSNIQKKKEVGSWTHHFFWNPREFFEINPLRGFKTRARKSIHGQKNLQKRLITKNIKSLLVFNEYSSFIESIHTPKTIIQCSSAESLPLPDESVDYIFTDPPYGDSIQYFELSTLWNSWLGFSIDNQEENEIVINNRQNKEIKSYFEKLSTVFRECYRVLKNQSYMTITFHNTDINIRNGLIKAVKDGGFLLDSSIFQMPARNSLKSYLHYEKSPVGDYFLRFKKDISIKTPQIFWKKEKVKELIINTVKGVLTERAEPTNLLFIYNCIDEELVKNQSFPLKKSSIIDETLQSMLDSGIISLSNEYMINLSQDNSRIVLNIPLKQRIEKFLKKVKNLHSMNYSQIYNKIYEQFNGWNTPDRKVTSKLIDEIK